MRASYQDPYVHSPLVARLLLDTVGQLAVQSHSEELRLVIETRPPRPDDPRTSPVQLGHDWRNATHRRDVIEELARKRGLRALLVEKEVPHGRRLRIEFSDGTAATIVLDQGFGAWAPPRGVTVRHDFSANTAAQAERLATINVILEKRGLGETYLVVTRS